MEADIVLALIAAIEAREITLVASDVLRFETENNPLPARRDFARRILALATADAASTAEVAARARHYERAGLKPLDAVHAEREKLFGRLSLEEVIEQSRRYGREER